jgi:hypothetical protein
MWEAVMGQPDRALHADLRVVEVTNGKTKSFTNDDLRRLRFHFGFHVRFSLSRAAAQLAQVRDDNRPRKNRVPEGTRSQVAGVGTGNIPEGNMLHADDSGRKHPALQRH